MSSVRRLPWTNWSSGEPSPGTAACAKHVVLVQAVLGRVEEHGEALARVEIRQGRVLERHSAPPEPLALRDRAPLDPANDPVDELVEIRRRRESRRWRSESCCRAAASAGSSEKRSSIGAAGATACGRSGAARRTVGRRCLRTSVAAPCAGRAQGGHRSDARSIRRCSTGVRSRLWRRAGRTTRRWIREPCGHQRASEHDKAVRDRHVMHCGPGDRSRRARRAGHARRSPQHALTQGRRTDDEHARLSLAEDERAQVRSRPEQAEHARRPPRHDPGRPAEHGLQAEIVPSARAGVAVRITRRIPSRTAASAFARSLRREISATQRVFPRAPGP